jgi:hypothetical protein
MDTIRLTGFDECRSLEEKEFASALAARAEMGNWYGDLWFFDEPLIVSVVATDDSADKYPLVLRTLRVDFFGRRVVVGKDPTHQLVNKLDPASPGVSSLESGTPTELAQFAADWLEGEMWRPIDRLEWPLSAPGCTLWVLADTGEGLVAKGFHSKLLGKPERRIRVHDKNMKVKKN